MINTYLIRLIMSVSHRYWETLRQYKVIIR